MKLTAKRIAGLAPAASAYIKYCPSRRNGLGVRVYPSGKKSFAVRYECSTCTAEKGRLVRHVEVLGPVDSMTLKQASSLANEWQERGRCNKVPAATSSEAPPPTAPKPGSGATTGSCTFKQAVTAWFEYKRDVQQQEAINTYLNTVNRHTPADWWERDITDITRREVMAVIEPMQAKFGSIDVQYQSHLNQIWKRAQKLEFYPENLRLPTEKIAWKPRRNRPKRIVMVQPKQIHFILNYDWPLFSPRAPGRTEEERTSTEFKRAMHLMLLTAQRGIEIQRMRWYQIGRQNGLILWKMEPGFIRKHKAPSEHTIPLVPEAFKLLGKPGRPGDFVFPALARWGHSRWSELVKIRQDEAGFSPRFRKHDIRTTFVTTAIEKFKTTHIIADLAISHTPKQLSDAFDNYNAGQALEQKLELYEKWTEHVLEIGRTPVHLLGEDQGVFQSLAIAE